MIRALLAVMTLVLVNSCTVVKTQAVTKPAQERKSNMDLGNFSVSLAVKDLQASKDFYSKLGFVKVGGDEEHNYLILQNGEAIVGLFQGMFDKNILTFNPGWAKDGNHPDEFTDIRDLQTKIKEAGLKPNPEADANTSGPASLMLMDPDGNPILIDQHR